MKCKQFEELHKNFIRIYGARIKKDKINYYEMVEYNSNVSQEEEASKETTFKLHIVIGAQEKTFGGFNKDEAAEVLDFLDKLLCSR